MEGGNKLPEGQQVMSAFVSSKTGLLEKGAYLCQHWSAAKNGNSGWTPKVAKGGWMPKMANGGWTPKMATQSGWMNPEKEGNH
jgi:hypothetical protein